MPPPPRNKVIVSTVGLVPEIRAFRESGIAKLAVSLHATTDEIRCVGVAMHHEAWVLNCLPGWQHVVKQ